MLLSVLVLPIYGWAEALALWQQVERLGFHGAYTYDHLAYEDLVGRYTQLGMTELVIHWPVPGSRFDNDPVVLDAVAPQGPAR